MVELKAVSPGFPYYGTLRLEGGSAYTHARVAGFGALVRPELLAQLGLRMGDAIALGGRDFTVRGVIAAEPGRRLGAFSLGPRVIVDIADLEQTSLLAFGSRVTLPAPGEGTRRRRVPGSPAALRDDLAQHLRARALLSSPPKATWAKTSRAPRTTCSLVGLVVVILGGVGVSSVTRVFVQQKIKSIAILKCLGARGSQVLAVYVAQVLALGLLGSVVGVLLGGRRHGAGSRAGSARRDRRARRRTTG